MFLVGYDCLDYILFTSLYYLLLIPTNFGFLMLPKGEKNGVAEKFRNQLSSKVRHTCQKIGGVRVV